jgi:hypothetical protein
MATAPRNTLRLSGRAAVSWSLTGTATAVELWKAVHEAHRHGALPITGNWVDLVAARA